jgi:hypothetical protein
MRCWFVSDHEADLLACTAESPRLSRVKTAGYPKYERR